MKHTRCASGEAYHRVRVARAVEQLHNTAAVWAAGAVTTKHVEAIVEARHAAHADEEFAEFEPALVEVAAAGTPEDVADAARQWRDALDDALDRDGAEKERVEEQEHERRRFDFSRSIARDGVRRSTLDVLGAEIVETALHLAYDAVHVADDPRTPAQQRADALVEICRTYIEGRWRSRANLPSILLVTDAATLAGEPVGECRLASGHRISPKTAQRLACDAEIQEVLAAGGVPLALGRAMRTFTPDQFRAMVVRDAHCRGPGCRVDPAHCEAHHLDEWERDDGPTDLDNGALFCRGHCHRMLHEGGWTITGNPNGNSTSTTATAIWSASAHQTNPHHRSKQNVAGAEVRPTRGSANAHVVKRCKAPSDPERNGKDRDEALIWADGAADFTRRGVDDP